MDEVFADSKFLVGEPIWVEAVVCTCRMPLACHVDKVFAGPKLRVSQPPVKLVPTGSQLPAACTGQRPQNKCYPMFAMEPACRRQSRWWSGLRR